MRTKALATCMLLACCAREEGEPSHSVKEITAGSNDAGDDAVVALTVQGQTFCTGTLIAPRVVLTAAHCLEAVPPSRIEVAFGLDAGSPNAMRIPVITGQEHPWYIVQNEGNDIAALGLAVAAPVPPMRLNDRPFDQGFVGATLRLVGYGTTQGMTNLGVGTKRQTVSVVTSFTDAEFQYGGTPGQTCQGDSGGPAFLRLGNVDVLAGVTSRGDAECNQFGIDTRVDAHIKQFIEPFAQSLDDLPPPPPPPPPPAPTPTPTPPPAPTPTPTPPAVDACYGVSNDGLCLGDLLAYCSNLDGTLHLEDCDGGRACECDANGWCDCLAPWVPADPCGGLDYAGQCDLNVVSWCEDDQVYAFDCTLLGGYCDWVDGVGFDCVL